MVVNVRVLYRSSRDTDADAVKQRTKGDAMKFSHLPVVVIT
jgi:hypothetical protein